MRLTEGLPIQVLIADRGYDMNQMVDCPFKRHCSSYPVQVQSDGATVLCKELYKERHSIENVFRWFKQWRGSATRSAQRSDASLAALY
ncbi:MAG: hypothetical protein LBO67_07625 [Spirochaetaceae bacterium]|nr:hypothetical protein [Spirochaetaceae bacterium]